MLEIYADQVQSSSWRVGDIVEDVRHGSPTQGCHFEIIDHEDGIIQLRELSDREYVVPGLVASRIK